MRLALTIVALAVLAGCAPGGSPSTSVTALDATTHDRFFPIAVGSHHGLGSDSPPITCNSCHGGAESFKQFDCLSCHQHANKAALDLSHGSLSGYAYVSSSCLGCHARGTAGQAPASPVSNPGASATVSAHVPVFSGTSIVSVAPQSEILPMPMLHTTAQVPAATLSSCATCHAGVAAGSYLPGLLHASLAAQPTSCAECHATSAPTGFVGPMATSPARTPPSPEMRHEAVQWLNGVPTATKLVQKDCASCHVAPTTAGSATWATGAGGAAQALFHASLAAAEQPASCLDCHANSRSAGILTSATASLPANVQFDHAAPAAQADCVTCHSAGAATQWTSWSKGQFHLARSTAPASCLPCHAGERPASASGWLSQTYATTPFDYGTNPQGVTHGGGLDCAACHAGPGTGAWGGTQNWAGGRFTHAAGSLSASTCIGCHSSQRPDLQPGTTAAQMSTLLNFDHSLNGSGDCFGCHQATVQAGSFATRFDPSLNRAASSDWKGGVGYPGATLIGSPSQFISTLLIALTRSGASSLVTGSTSTQATIYNQFLHISGQIPAQLSPGPADKPDNSKCGACHVSNNGPFSNGQFHSAVTKASLPQPTSHCTDCHSSMPAGIVEGAGLSLQPMDHSALFTGGSGVAQLDCSTCHKNPAVVPGQRWSGGLFHAYLAGATPQDCTVCHYPGMADTAKADVVSGVNFAMKHSSAQLTFQNCQTCHASALARATTTPLASTLWQGGAFHANATPRPSACIDCHSVSVPASNAPTQSSVRYTFALGGTATNSGQWMNHGDGSVIGKDCASCHAADASGSAPWSNAISFHGAVPPPKPTGCQGCHGLQNGNGAVAGTRNNLPAGLTNATLVSSAANDPATGVPAGTHDQIDHGDLNVQNHDCLFCHTQQGVAAPSGQEWAKAAFHASFPGGAPLTNGTTARCSTCHINVKPTAAFTAFDHSALSSLSGTQDCASCHSWPGTGGAAAPDWRGATGAAPTTIIVGGFTIPAPPATGATTQATASLPHPSTATTSCATCHTGGAGGKKAIGYDHNPKPATCNGCHEAGTSAGPAFVGTVWNNSTTESNTAGVNAGDTRPFTLGGVWAEHSGNSTFESPSNSRPKSANHFFPIDCQQCHTWPTGISQVTTGGAYLSFSTAGTRSTGAWAFPHNETAMGGSSSATCLACHPNGPPN